MFAVVMSDCVEQNISRPQRVALFNSGTNWPQTEIACFGGGPFWCMESIFLRLPSVISVTSGFAGGHVENPAYYEVCNGKTGHAEVVQIEFDPAKISYEKLLAVFWHAHDPTRFNNALDVGPQYRSIILYRDENQKLMASLSKSQAQNRFAHPIVTEIAPFKKFHKADARHQGYYDSNIEAPYCQIIIAPRLQALENNGVIPKKSETDFLRKPRAA